MKLFDKRLKKSSRWKTVLCPKQQKRFEENREKCYTWTVVPSSFRKFEVRCHPAMIVDLVLGTCSCGGWQYDGFPCSHVVASILKTNVDNPYQFIKEYFHTESYVNCYSGSIPAISTFGQSVSSALVVNPPLTKRQPGRPRKRRIRSRGEDIKKRIKCGRCGSYGFHNRRTCDSSFQHCN